MIFVESPWFAAWRDKALSQDQFDAMVLELLADPKRGDLIPRSKGLRKIRVGLSGRGKRGGGRVIYYHWDSEDRVYLLFGYAKSVRQDLSKDQLARLAVEMSKEWLDG